MTKREIEKMLKKAGFVRRTGGKPDIWIKSGCPTKRVPRHKVDIPIGTAKNILKAAGLEKLK